MEVISGPEGVDLKSYVVENGTTRTFGGYRRSASKDVTGITDRTMSNPHFRISNIGGRITLCDCESLNGTKINGRKLSEEMIEETTVFQAGRTRFQVRWERRPDDSIQKLNPFDPQSIAPTEDVQDPLKTENSIHIINSAPIGSSNFSPFESSVIEPSPPSASNLPNRADPSEGPSSDTDGSLSDESPCDPVVRLILHTSSPGRDFEKMIRRLSTDFDFFAIAHLAKLNRDDRNFGIGIPLYPHLDPTGSALPTAISKIEWFSRCHIANAERLAANDGLMIVLCRPQSQQPEKGLVEMGLAALSGFSEKGGFVPWCWPSGAASVLESMSDAMIAKWLGSSLMGIVYPQADRIVAYSSRDGIEALINQGFC